MDASAPHLDSPLRLSFRTIALWSALIFLLAFAHGALRMGRPFIGDKEGTACGLVMMPPINYLRYGPFQQRLGGIINAGQVELDHLASYVHHPPGVTITSAIAHAAFGRADWVARLVPTIFTALTASLLFVALAREGRVRTGVLAAAIFVFLPIVTLYGGMPDYVNFQVAFFAGLALWLWLESVVRPNRWLQAGSLLAFTLACISDWPGFYVAPVIWIGAWAIRARFDWFDHVVYPAVATTLLVLLASWLAWAGSDISLIDRVLLRSAGGLDRGEGAITFDRWITGVPAMMSELHTLPAMACVLLYLGLTVVSVARALGRRASAFSPSPMILLLVGILLVHFVVARQGTFQHEWWHVMFTPAIAACAGAILHAALRLIEPRVTLRHMGTAVAVVLVGVLAWWSASMDADRRSQFSDAGGYTLQELGAVISRAAAPDEGVLTSDSSDWVNRYAQSALGWYADRQMRPCIIDVPTFEASLGAGPYPLFFAYQQPGGPRPSWFVMPIPHRESLSPLSAELDARYARTTDGNFHIYDLRQPK